MIYLGIDYGSKRIGIACSDEMGITADPVCIITSDSKDKIWQELIKVINENRASTVVVGLPRRTTGEIGVEAQAVFGFVEELKKRVSVDVLTWDERFTSQEADRLMREADLSIKKRKEKRDAIAAKIMLQSFLDYQRMKDSSCTN